MPTPDMMPTEPLEEMPSSIDMPSVEQALHKKIERWKSDLLDTGKSNRMINFRETKRTTLRIWSM